MQILQLSWEYPPLVYGRLGRHVHALAEAQAALGHEVTVLTGHVKGAVADETVRGVRIIRVPYDPPMVPQSDLLAWVLGLGHAVARAGSRLGEQWRPDVVHAHDWLMCHAGTALKEALGVGLVATMHSTEAGRHQGWLPSPLSRAIHTTERWLTFESRRVITCSAHMRWEVTRLFELPPDKVDLVANGIDRAAWSVPARTAATSRARYAGTGPLLVYAGRLEWEKGVHTLLQAVPRLRRRHSGLRLVVAGEGTFGAELRERARAARLGPSVTFTGFLPREELAALVAAADCAVVPSLYEPFGLAALEAAALGTPLVVSGASARRWRTSRSRSSCWPASSRMPTCLPSRRYSPRRGGAPAVRCRSRSPLRPSGAIVLVVDASVLVVALADDGADGDHARRRLIGERLAAPEIIDLEVASVLRRLLRLGSIPLRRADLALADLAALPMQRVPHRHLVARCWQLRDNLTSYDAAYVTVAEAFNSTLLTSDQRVAKAPGARCPVELIRSAG